MTKQSTLKISLLAGLITGLLALNCSAETTRASNASSNLGYKSSLSGFKSINDNAAELTANDSLEEMKSRDSAPEAVSKPAKVKKSKPSKKLSKPVLPAKANPHQNHQM